MVLVNHCGWTRWPFIFSGRPASVVWHASAFSKPERLQSVACHLGQLRGTVQEYELMVNRSGLPHDLSPDQLDELWICEKHRGNMSKNWRPRRTCQYPLHNGWKKQLNTRYALHLDMSREINTIFVELVPTGSLEYDFYVNSSLLTRYCPEMWGRV